MTDSAAGWPWEREWSPGVREAHARLIDSPEALTRLATLRGWSREACEWHGLGVLGTQVLIPLPGVNGNRDSTITYEPDPADRGEKKMSVSRGSRRDLYPPPELIPPTHSEYLWLVEGPPDAIAATSVGLTAISFPSAGIWRSEWAIRFADRRVVLSPDADGPGRSKAKEIADDLAAHGIDVRIVDLHPDRDDGSDFTDFVRHARTPSDRAGALSLLTQLANAQPVHESLSVGAVRREEATECVGEGPTSSSLPVLLRTSPSYSKLLEAAQSPDQDVRRDALVALDGRPEFVEPLGELVGFDHRPGVSFQCVLPEHRHQALLEADANGILAYCCGATGELLPFADVYAAWVAGDYIELPGPSRARWKIRSLAELGQIELPEVTLPPLPPSSSASLAQVHRAVELLFRVRRVTDPHDPGAPLEREFVARWAGWPITRERTTGRRIAKLAELGVIVDGGWYEWREPTYQLLRLWLPDPGVAR